MRNCNPKLPSSAVKKTGIICNLSRIVWILSTNIVMTVIRLFQGLDTPRLSISLESSE